MTYKLGYPVYMYFYLCFSRSHCFSGVLELPKMIVWFVDANR